MDFYIIHFIQTLILPPGIILTMLLATIWLSTVSAIYARRVLIATTALLYLVSMPLTAGFFMGALENHPALEQRTINNHGAKAIVILGGGRERNAAEFGQDIVSMGTLERLRYGAFLQSKTNLPILVTGGFIDPKDTPEGILMAQSLENDFKIKARWQENRSRNTAENAIYSRDILAAENINTIFLVTKAWHLPRAVETFEKQGFTVIPAPTGFAGPNKADQGSFSLYDFLPAAYAIQSNLYAFHETLGRIWYFIRY